MPMRILQVVTYMGRAGLETMLMNYYRHLDREKIQFDFLVHRDFAADYDEEILALGGRIYHLPPMNPFSPQYRRALDAFFQEHREYQVVHCHLDCLTGIVLKAAKKYGVPVRIAHAHSSSQDKNLKYPIKRLYRPLINRYATDYFACVRSAGRWTFRREDFRILNNAIDAPSYAWDPQVRTQVRQELGLGETALVVGHVGRFMAPKNHTYLLKIFAKMPSASRLLLVGEGELQAGAEALAEELGIRDRVIFAGLRSDVNRLLQAMDVFVLPSLYEGLPVSMVEAQTAGLPCVISDKVPMDSDLTGLVTQVPLDAGEEAWAQAIQKAAQKPRADTLDVIRAAGFDIAASARWLERYYLSQ